jgi:hypothetical protein
MRRFILWLIPPLLGAGGYLLAGGGSPHPATDASNPAAPAGKTASRQAPITNLTAEFQRLEEAWQRQSSEQQRLAEHDKDDLSKLDGAELRARIQQLIKQHEAFDDDTDWPTLESHAGKIREALHELAKSEGQAAVDWIDEHFPKLRLDVMDGWAAGDPEGALQAVLASKRKPPCSYETLTRLLLTRAAASPSALREASDRIPWEQFSYTAASSDPFSTANSIEFPEETDLRPWIESGTAQAMARDGVSIGNLFRLWGKQDPAQALAQVEDWPAVATPLPQRLSGILLAGYRDKESQQRIAHALENLPPEQLQRLATAAKESGEHNLLIKLYPGILTEPEAVR